MSTKKTYGEKLRDPRWQRVRLLVMERDSFTCQLCGDKTVTQNIHHLSYVADPWDCPPAQLITLCEDCHGIISILDLDLNNNQVTIRRIPRSKHNTFLVIENAGIHFFMKWPGKLLEHYTGVTHDILKFIVHDIINYWLKTDKENYLTDKLTVSNG